MGAGCYYTLSEDRDTRAYWVDVDMPDPEDEDYCDDLCHFAYSDVKDYLKDVFLSLEGACECNDKLYYKDSYILVLKPTYDGDGVLLDFEYQSSDPNGLETYNYPRSYQKIIREMNKSLVLRIATSGYTSREIPIGEAA